MHGPSISSPPSRSTAAAFGGGAIIGTLGSLIGFTRYSQDRSFAVLGKNWRFVLVMASGSLIGTFIGGQLLGIVPTAVLPPLLATILVISAVKVWRH